MYRDEGDDFPRKQIEMATVIEVHLRTERKKEEAFRFDLYTDNRVISLKAETKDDYEQWTKVLMEAQEFYKQ